MRVLDSVLVSLVSPVDSTWGQGQQENILSLERVQDSIRARELDREFAAQQLGDVLHRIDSATGQQINERGNIKQINKSILVDICFRLKGSVC